MKIGIGITTRNRPGQAEFVVDRIREVTPWNYEDITEPVDFEIVVVDDASDEPVPKLADGTFRFEENVGIARAKNKCLGLLDENDHIFLFDDDAYPIAVNWWLPYVKSPEPHLMYQFGDLAGPRKLRDITELYRDDEHVAWSGPRGVMLYIDTQKVLPVVGGLDPIYGKWGYEHGDWSNRIHHAGLTSWRYADVVGSERLIHSMDEHLEINRSVASGDRANLVRQNASTHDVRRAKHYQGYVDYRSTTNPKDLPGDRDVVITHLYSSNPDPQRPGVQLANTLEPAYDLLNSIAGDIVIVHDGIEARPTPNVELVQSSWSINVFFQRHLDSWRYLRDHPEIRWVWCVDATDVEMLHEPWEEMEVGLLYIGYEPTTVGCNWLRVNHPTSEVQRFIRANRNRQLLNPGVIGGDRETVMAFLHDMVRFYFDNEMNRFMNRENSKPDLGDMGATQVVAAKHESKIRSGPKVVTVFRANDRTGSSWWRHK